MHIEFFGTLEEIAEAKRELLENLAPNGTVVVNNDNEHVVPIISDYDGPMVSTALEHDAALPRHDMRERGLLGTRFTLAAESERRELESRPSGTPQPLEPPRGHRDGARHRHLVGRNRARRRAR